MHRPDDTIVAPATPPGRGGVAIVRLSGERSLQVAAALVEGERVLQPRLATLVRVHSRPRESTTAGILDEAIVTFFPAGASYTGEDVVEISLHGSPLIVGEVVAAAVAAGARLARPGEFTLRAFLNGRLDLTRAEAVNDLVEATTVARARAAFDQLSGTLAERIAEIEREIFDLIVRLEASGDFPDEGYHFVSHEEARRGVAAILQRVERLLADARRGRLIRDGVSVAIVGRPNVGKSTLFNRLAGAERAIVTAIPGTTRDVLTESVMLAGTRMLLADTAGIRESGDPVEREGVERARRASGAADATVVVLDGSESLDPEDLSLLDATRGRPRVIAINKCDLNAAASPGVAISDTAASRSARGAAEPPGASGGTADRCVQHHRPGSDSLPGDAPVVRLSALTGEGVDELVRVVADVVGLGLTTETPAVTNERHFEALERAAGALRRASESMGAIGRIPEEVLLSDLQEARSCFDEISGKRTTGELLEAIFSRFCIGK